MDDHFKIIGRAVEQPVRFNQFQTFVHHGSGIDRDFPAHTPIRMFYGLSGRDVFESGQISIKKRAAGGG